MALCRACGKKLTAFNKSTEDLCATCLREGRTEAKFVSGNLPEVEAVMLTTESSPNLKILKRLEVVTAECAFGMSIFKDLFSSVRDIAGGRSETVQKTMRASRRVALYELKKEAHVLGANAVVAVDLDYVELSAAGNMLLLVASGTAVVIEDQ